MGARVAPMFLAAMPPPQKSRIRRLPAGWTFANVARIGQLCCLKSGQPVSPELPARRTGWPACRERKREAGQKARPSGHLDAEPLPKIRIAPSSLSRSVRGPGARRVERTEHRLAGITANLERRLRCKW